METGLGKLHSEISLPSSSDLVFDNKFAFMNSYKDFMFKISARNETLIQNLEKVKNKVLILITT